MQTAEYVANPFMLMMEPETVVRAMRRSSGLRSLEHHKYRPLDRPWIPFANDKKTVESLVRHPADLHPEAPNGLAH